MINIEKLRSLFRWKVRIIVTKRRRSSTGFNVTGPDGKTYWAPTRKEALSNLKVRMQCHEVQPWKVSVALEVPRVFGSARTPSTSQAPDSPPSKQ
jgi:hypothetical protein